MKKRILIILMVVSMIIGSFSGYQVFANESSSALNTERIELNTTDTANPKIVDISIGSNRQYTPGEKVSGTLTVRTDSDIKYIRITIKNLNPDTAPYTYLMCDINQDGASYIYDSNGDRIYYWSVDVPVDSKWGYYELSSIQMTDVEGNNTMFYNTDESTDIYFYFEVMGTAIPNRYYVKNNSDYHVMYIVLGQKYKGQMLKGVVSNANTLAFVENDRIVFIDMDNITEEQVVGTIYTKGSVNIRHAMDNSILGTYRMGTLVNGMEYDDYIFFSYNSYLAKAHKSLLQYGDRAYYNLKGTANVRDQKLNVVGRKYKGDTIYGVIIGNYVRYYENGVRFIHKSLVSTDFVSGTAYTKGSSNLRSVYSETVVQTLKIGEYLEGYRDGDYVILKNKE